MKRIDLFPSYFDILDIKLFFQGDEFSSNAEQDDYAHKAIMMHDDFVDITKKLVDTVNWLKDTDDINGAPECTWDDIYSEIKKAEDLIKEAKS